MDIVLTYRLSDGSVVQIPADDDKYTVLSYLLLYSPIEPEITIKTGSTVWRFYLMDLIEYIDNHYPKIPKTLPLIEMIRHIPDVYNIPQTDKPYLTSSLKRTSIGSIGVGYERVRVTDTVVVVNEGSDVIIRPIDKPIDSQSYHRCIFSIEGLWYPIDYHPNTRFWYVQDGYDTIDRLYRMMRYRDTKRNLSIIPVDYREKLPLYRRPLMVYDGNNPYRGIGIDFETPITGNTILTIGGCLIPQDQYTIVNNTILVIDFYQIDFYTRLAILNYVYEITPLPTMENDYTDTIVLSSLFSIPGSYLYLLDTPITTYQPAPDSHRWAEMRQYGTYLIDSRTYLDIDSILFKSSIPIEITRLNGHRWSLSRSDTYALIQ